VEQEEEELYADFCMGGVIVVIVVVLDVCRFHLRLEWWCSS